MYLSSPLWIQAHFVVSVTKLVKLVFDAHVFTGLCFCQPRPQRTGSPKSDFPFCALTQESNAVYYFTPWIILIMCIFSRIFFFLLNLFMNWKENINWIETRWIIKNWYLFQVWSVLSKHFPALGGGHDAVALLYMKRADFPAFQCKCWLSVFVLNLRTSGLCSNIWQRHKWVLPSASVAFTAQFDSVSVWSDHSSLCI